MWGLTAKLASDCVVATGQCDVLGGKMSHVCIVALAFLNNSHVIELFASQSEHPY